jgi:hypothetical protein
MAPETAEERTMPEIPADKTINARQARQDLERNKAHQEALAAGDQVRADQLLTDR